jgi:hypothetical protein
MTVQAPRPMAFWKQSDSPGGLERRRGSVEKLFGHRFRPSQISRAGDR